MLDAHTQHSLQHERQQLHHSRAHLRNNRVMCEWLLNGHALLNASALKSSCQHLMTIIRVRLIHLAIPPSCHHFLHNRYAQTFSMMFAVIVGVAATVFAPHVARCSATPVICEDDVTKSLSARRAGPCPTGSKPVRMAGANIYDALWDAWVAPAFFSFCEFR